jgi:hypothetical protein
MADCFISYASPDERLATDVAQYLRWRGLEVFMAGLSLQPGDTWNAEIQNALRTSPWVVFLASRVACASAYVQQEVGGAVFGGKKLVPVIWDMPPSDLPGWAKHYQALDLRGLPSHAVAQQVEHIAEAIHASKRQGAFIAGGIIAGLLLLALGGKD